MPTAPPVCIVTGANAGIGKEAARQLAARGAVVVMLCRSAARGEAARSDILGADPDPDMSGRLHLMRADMGSMASVRAFAAAFLQRFDRLDVLINNAALFDVSIREPTLTDDGFEQVWAINYLGPYLLTRLLFDRLEASRGRVIDISSKGLVAFPFLRVDFDNLAGETSYSVTKAYYQSKLALLMFTRSLDQRFEHAAACAIRVPAVYVPDERLPAMNGLARAIFKLKRRFALKPEVMAETYTWAALDAPIDTLRGTHLDERRRSVGFPRGSRDEATRARLWALSEQETGIDPGEGG